MKETQQNLPEPHNGDHYDNLVWHIEIDPAHKPTITPDNLADFKQLHLFERVRKEQPLATKPVPEDGEPSLNFKFPAGKNTRISEDGRILFADIDGYAFWRDGLIHVDSVYRIPGDVDYSTGNIKCEGSVVIEGDVRSGFRVEAGESVIIGGNVDAAYVYSRQGDVNIQYGVLGRNRAKILAGGNLHCGFVQEATLGVKKDIRVDHYLINSTVSAGGSVRLEQHEGLIRGGNIVAGHSIYAREIGSEKSRFTELQIRPVEDESTREIWEITRKRGEIQLRISSLEKQLKFNNLLDRELPQLSAEKKKEMIYVREELERLNGKLEIYGQLELDLFKKINRTASQREIAVSGTLHPNVQVIIDGWQYHNTESKNNLRLFPYEQEICLQPLYEKK